MITANSTRLHRVDTSFSGRGGMVNLNSPATAPGPLLDSDLQHLDATPIPPPAVRSRPSRPTRRRFSLLRILRVAVLRYQVWETARYIAQCEREGILGTRSMREFRDQLGALRVRLAIAEAS